MQLLKEKYDVVVCGGGLAGVCAAIASARNGASTCILQDRPVFGGNSSSEIRVYPQGAANYHAYARETGVISELLIEERAVNHEPNHHNGRANSVWDMLLYDKVMSTPNLSFHLNTTVYEASLGDDSEIRVLKARIANAEVELAIRAEVFIDCTGDGIVAALAGCAWSMGTEGRAEFGEPHAPVEASGEVMGSSIHFRAKDMGRPVPFKAPDWACHYDDPDVFRKGGRPLNDPEGGFWWIELGVPWNTIAENETIRHELTRHVLGIWDYMKSKDPDMRLKAMNYAIDWIGQVPGKRESRRIHGPVMLTELDMLNHTVFNDEIAYGGWYIDLHKAGGLLAEYSEQAAAEGHESAYMNKSYVPPYGIPLRCLIAKGVPNLLLAGRNISVTHVALGSTRVMGTTALLGQAAGTAAAIAIDRGESVNALSGEAIGQLKQRLLRDDMFLLHTVNEDEADLARRATITASSELLIGEAAPAAGSGRFQPDRLVPGGTGSMSDSSSTPRGAVLDNPADDRLRLTARRGQWIATSTGRIDSLAICVSNRSGEPQVVEASLVQVDHIWDYAMDSKETLARTTLSVPPGDSQWLEWPVKAMLPPTTASHQYVRLELGPNEDLVWHAAGEVMPGMTAAYDTGAGTMRRFGDGETMSFRISPPQVPYPASHVISGVARPYRSTNLWRSAPLRTVAGIDTPSGMASRVESGNDASSGMVGAVAYGKSACKETRADDHSQWLELAWPQPVGIREIRLTFAGNLLRDYRFYEPLSCDASVVRTYRASAWVDGEWRVLAEVEGNYQRLRSHQVEPVTTRRLRICVYETNGDPCASIFECRVYG